MILDFTEINLFNINSANIFCNYLYTLIFNEEVIYINEALALELKADFDVDLITGTTENVNFVINDEDCFYYLINYKFDFYDLLSVERYTDYIVFRLKEFNTVIRLDRGIDINKDAKTLGNIRYYAG